MSPLLPLQHSACIVEVLPSDYTVAVAADPSPALQEKTLSFLKTGSLSVVTNSSFGFVTVLPSHVSATEQQWTALKLPGPVCPWLLAAVCEALAAAKVEATVSALKPACAAHFLVRQSDLDGAVGAIVRLGCALHWRGSISPSYPLPLSPIPLQALSGFWRHQDGTIRLQSKVGLFIELDIVSDVVQAFRSGYTLKQDSQEITRSTVVSSRPPNHLHKGLPAESDLHGTGNWRRLENSDIEVLSLELESESPSCPHGLRRGVWLFAGKHFARIIGPEIGSPQSVIASTICGNINVLQQLKGAEAVDHDIETHFEVIFGEVEQLGMLKIAAAHRGAGLWSRPGTALFHSDDSETTGRVEFLLEDRTLKHYLPNRTQHVWKVREITCNPFSSEGLLPWAEDAEDGASLLVNTSSTPDKVLKPGSKVKYWSQTVKRWISAILLSLNPDGTYDLDLKKRAQPQFVRPAKDKNPESALQHRDRKTQKKETESSEEEDRDIEDANQSSTVQTKPQRKKIHCEHSEDTSKSSEKKKDKAKANKHKLPAKKIAKKKRKKIVKKSSTDTEDTESTSRSGPKKKQNPLT